MRFEAADLVIIAIVAILLFGGSRIPEVARSLSKAIREFRSALEGESDKKDVGGEKLPQDSEKK